MNNKDPELRFKRGDMIAIAAVLALAAIVFCSFLPLRSGGEGGQLCIWQDGQLLQRLPLTLDQTIEVIGDYTNVVTIENGRAAITGSNCPGMDCVHSGWIDSPGRSIACLPNRVELRIEALESDVDFVVG